MANNILTTNFQILSSVLNVLSTVTLNNYLSATNPSGNGTLIIDSIQNGLNTAAIGSYSHVEGYFTSALASGTHAEGAYTMTLGLVSHTEGINTIAAGLAAHAEGSQTSAFGPAAHAEGLTTIASGDCSHAEGENTKVYANCGHAEGAQTIVIGSNAHTEGFATSANEYASHAEGAYTVADEKFSHAEGYYTSAAGYGSHAEGNSTLAMYECSHAEGNNTVAFAECAHSEGSETSAVGLYSHAEGSKTVASGGYSHAEGRNTKSNAVYSHAEGQDTIANGEYSHAEGLNTIANSNHSHVEGKYNIIDLEDQYQHIVGNGTDDENRKNMQTLDWSGNEWNAGNVSAAHIYSTETSTYLDIDLEILKSISGGSVASAIISDTSKLDVDLNYTVDKTIIPEMNFPEDYTFDINKIIPEEASTESHQVFQYIYEKLINNQLSYENIPGQFTWSNGSAETAEVFLKLTYIENSNITATLGQVKFPLVTIDMDETSISSDRFKDKTTKDFTLRGAINTDDGIKLYFTISFTKNIPDPSVIHIEDKVALLGDIKIDQSFISSTTQILSADLSYITNLSGKAFPDYTYKVVSVEDNQGMEYTFELAEKLINHDFKYNPDRRSEQNTDIWDLNNNNYITNLIDAETSIEQGYCFVEGMPNNTPLKMEQKIVEDLSSLEFTAQIEETEGTNIITIMMDRVLKTTDTIVVSSMIDNKFLTANNPRVIGTLTADNIDSTAGNISASHFFTSDGTEITPASKELQIKKFEFDPVRSEKLYVGDKIDNLKLIWDYTGAYNLSQQYLTLQKDNDEKTILTDLIWLRDYALDYSLSSDIPAKYTFELSAINNDEEIFVKTLSIYSSYYKIYYFTSENESISTSSLTDLETYSHDINCYDKFIDLGLQKFKPETASYIYFIIPKNLCETIYDVLFEVNGIGTVPVQDISKEMSLSTGFTITYNVFRTPTKSLNSTYCHVKFIR